MKRLVTKLRRKPRLKGEEVKGAKGLAAWSMFHPTWTLAPNFKPSSTNSLRSGDWTECRSEARRQFESEDFETARKLYIHEVKSMFEGVEALAALALDTSEAHHALKQHEEASLACAVSVLLDRTNPRAWHRQAHTIESIQSASAAIRFLKGLMDEQSVPTSIIDICKGRIEELRLKQVHESHVKEVSDRSTEEQRFERSTREFDNGDTDHERYNAAMEITLPMAREMVSLQPSSEPLSAIIQVLSKRRAPSVETEYAKYMGWPAGFASQLGTALFRKGYLNASSHPWMTASLIALGRYQVDVRTVLKRWNGPHRATIYYRRQATLSVGDLVEPGPNDPVGYEPCMRSVFMNAPASPLADFQCGTVHVSIGFNDLGELLSSSLHRSSAASDINGTQPLRFVGVDKSEYAVARCLVIRELLLDPQVPISVVFQVWYSAG